MMTEPVAYLHKSNKNKKEVYLEFGVSDSKNFDSIPLYTSEQLHPRVKMTKEQHKQFENYKKGKNSFYHFWQSFIVDDISLRKEFSERELMLVWLDEEKIEIVPETKWFVRVDSQIPLPDENIYLDDELIVYPHYNSPKSSAHQFDTKEEADLWTNPLTEAVQLPVEG